ncbi:protein kinase domain-containing protein [Ktedonospora formicarum]|uniref:Protein kinase domain-containing protein n=1 Tax=Ktedonospora formicarum TaxID=2778364 RepID=A0A8J3MUH6_9CHLR|nr:hypothetical protein [Ktedonospora formicarum]GHO49362.1 hypothetical protein KSX_75250 [Ktedonospora formicarum]
MLTPDHKFFLIDFGIARTFTRGKAKDTIPLGSPGYAPPEQYGRAQTNQRSDIYSLGATLQTLVTGREPLELSSGEPSRNPNGPSRKLRKLLAKMLSADAARRPATMSRVKEYLTSLQYRPINIFLSGAVFGFIYSLFIPFTTYFKGLIWVGLLALPIAKSVEMLISKMRKQPMETPKGLRRYWWLGMLIGTLPMMLFMMLFTHS